MPHLLHLRENKYFFLLKKQALLVLSVCWTLNPWRNLEKCNKPILRKWYYRWTDRKIDEQTELNSKDSPKSRSSTRSCEITLQVPTKVIDFILKWFKFNSLKASTKKLQTVLGKWKRSKLTLKIFSTVIHETNSVVLFGITTVTGCAISKLLKMETLEEV